MLQELGEKNTPDKKGNLFLLQWSSGAMAKLNIMLADKGEMFTWFSFIFAMKAMNLELRAPKLITGILLSAINVYYSMF